MPSTRGRRRSPRSWRTLTRKKAEAKKERDEFQHKNEEFDQQRAALLSKATDEAKAERQRLLDEARKAADALSAKRREALGIEARSLNKAVSRRAPAGSVRHRPEGADGPRHDEPGRAHGRGVHSPPARDGWQGEGGPRRGHQDGVPAGARAHRVRSARGAARGDPECAQRDLLGGRPGPVRDRAGSGERDRARHERSKGGLEHRGLPHVAGEGRGRTPEGARRRSGQGRGEGRPKPEARRTDARGQGRTEARREARGQGRTGRREARGQGGSPSQAERARGEGRREARGEGRREARGQGRPTPTPEAKIADADTKPDAKAERSRGEGRREARGQVEPTPGPRANRSRREARGQGRREAEARSTDAPKPEAKAEPKPEAKAEPKPADPKPETQSQ